MDEEFWETGIEEPDFAKMESTVDAAAGLSSTQSKLLKKLIRGASASWCSLNVKFTKRAIYAYELKRIYSNKREQVSPRNMLCSVVIHCSLLTFFPVVVCCCYCSSFPLVEAGVGWTPTRCSRRWCCCYRCCSCRCPCCCAQGEADGQDMRLREDELQRALWMQGEWTGMLSFLCLQWCGNMRQSSLLCHRRPQARAGAGSPSGACSHHSRGKAGETESSAGCAHRRRHAVNKNDLLQEKIRRRSLAFAFTISLKNSH